MLSKVLKRKVKSKQWVAFFLAIVLLMSAVPVSAVSSAEQVPPGYFTLKKRLAGQDRYETASAIALRGWQQSEYAVLTYGENFPDALAATPLAHKYKAPILLTKTERLPEITQIALTTLQVKTIFIVGGSGVISDQIVYELQGLGMKTTRIAGADRYETAVKVAERLSSPSSLFVVTGEDYADALTVASVAASKQIPILLVPNDNMPDSVRRYLAEQRITATFVVGNSGFANAAVAKQFPNPEVIQAEDQYQRNIAVNTRFAEDFGTNGFCLATGEDFADALTGAAYAAKSSQPIILMNHAPTKATLSYFHKRLPLAATVTIFGGTSAISDEIIAQISSKP